MRKATSINCYLCISTNTIKNSKALCKIVKFLNVSDLAISIITIADGHSQALLFLIKLNKTAVQSSTEAIIHSAFCFEIKDSLWL